MGCSALGSDDDVISPVLSCFLHSNTLLQVASTSRVADALVALTGSIAPILLQRLQRSLPAQAELESQLFY